MIKTILIIVGIVVFCVVAYGWMDASAVNATRRRKEQESKKVGRKMQREIDCYRQDTLNKADALVAKYLKSPLTTLLLDEISIISSGKYIHQISLNTMFGTLKIYGGAQKIMYINNLSQLGETSKFENLGYKLPTGDDYDIHSVALLKAIAQKLGSDYKVDITYESDSDKYINRLEIYSKNLKFEYNLKSPV